MPHIGQTRWVDDEPWAATAADQRDLLTRSQLREFGITRDQLRWRLGRSWRLVLPSVVDVRTVEGGGSSQLSQSRRLVAAGARGGPGCCGERPPCLPLARDRQRPRHPAGAPARPTAAGQPGRRLRAGPADDSTRRPGGPLWRHPDRQSSARRRRRRSHQREPRRGCEHHDRGNAAALGFAGRRPARGRGGTPAARTRPLRVGRDAVGRLVDARGGPARSLCEQRGPAARVAEPRLETADARALVSPDLWFDDVALAVMVHSRAHHARDADWEGTVERDGQLELGVVVLGFTPGRSGSTPSRCCDGRDRLPLGRCFRTPPTRCPDDAAGVRLLAT